MMKRIIGILSLLSCFGLVCVASCIHPVSGPTLPATTQANLIGQTDTLLAVAAQIEAAVVKATAGRDVNEPVTGWILAGSVPFCFGVYVLAHRLRWFQALKYGSNDRSK